MKDEIRTANDDTSQRQAELAEHRAMVVASGDCTVADMVHDALLRLQLSREQDAPQLEAADPASGRRLHACAALADWLLRDGGFPRQCDVADYLNERGQRTRSGSPWTQATVSKLVRDYRSEVRHVS